MRRTGDSVASRLVSEARAMLRQGGVRAVKLRALADRVGITAGSMYYHFENKSALLGILAASGFRQLTRELEAACDECGEAREIRAWAKAYFAFAQREPALFELMFDPEISAGANVREARSNLLASFRKTVGGMNAHYGLNITRIEEITLAIWAAAHGAASLGPGLPEEMEFLDKVIAGLEAIAMLHSQRRSG
jgi:AcrR family transcriptional regulator